MTDFETLLRSLSAAGVRYIVIGWDPSEDAPGDNWALAQDLRSSGWR